MAEGLLQCHLEASLPFLEAAPDWFEAGEGLGDVSTPQRVVVLDDLPRVVNLWVSRGKLGGLKIRSDVPGSD